MIWGMSEWFLSSGLGGSSSLCEVTRLLLSWTQSGSFLHITGKTKGTEPVQAPLDQGPSQLRCLLPTPCLHALGGSPKAPSEADTRQSPCHGTGWGDHWYHQHSISGSWMHLAEQETCTEKCQNVLCLRSRRWMDAPGHNSHSSSSMVLGWGWGTKCFELPISVP